jgi:hypothetical protein
MTARSVAIRGFGGPSVPLVCRPEPGRYTHRDLSVLGRFVEDEQVHLLDIGRDDRVGEVRGRPPEGSPRSRAGSGPTG